MGLTAAVAYLPSLAHGFIYDDYWTIVSNRHLDKSLTELLSAAASGRSVEWKMPDATRPLIGLSLWGDRQVFGVSPSGHHLDSLLLYALVSVVAFLLAFALLRSFAGALVAGIAFAVMPLHCEVVAAVNYREDLLATLFLFAAMTICFWPAQRFSLAPRDDRWRPWCAASLWLCALASKESAVVAPLLLGVLALVRRPPRWIFQAPLALSAAVVALLWGNWRAGVSMLGEQIPQADYASWLERLLRTARFELASVWNSLLPVLARPEFNPQPEAHALWIGALLLVLAGWTWLLLRRSTRPAAGVLGVALVAPLAASPLFAPINELADRYWFTGSIAAALALGWGVRQLARRWNAAAVGALGVLCAAGVVQCWSASSVWASETSLWTSAVALAPQSPRAWTSLSRVHRMADQGELAEEAIARALALKSDYVPGQVARALNLLWLADRSAARRVLAPVVPKSDLHRDALALASRCAWLPTDAAASECARRAVPRGMVLGDVDLLRKRSEQLLTEHAASPQRSSQ
ncbi:MAG: hypothetical protein RL685_3844 [Pseudomonadota bacterium]